LRKHITQAKKDLRKIQYQATIENRRFNKIKILADHDEELYNGLEQLKHLHKLPLVDAENKALEIYRNEVKRLETLLEQYRTQNIEAPVNNPVLLLKPTKLIWSSKPFELYRNIKLYRLEKKEKKELVKKLKDATVHISIEKDGYSLQMQNDSTTQYKPENLEIKSKHITTDEKIVSTYYLVDVPTFLTDDILFKLETSHLPFTISMFIEPTNSQELIKKARDRQSVLDMQRQERMNNGKLKDQKLEKHIDETTQFIYELVNEYEKGFLFSFYLSMEAENTHEMKTMHKELKNITDAIELNVTRYIYGQKKAYETMLPFHEDRLKQNRLFQTSAVAYLSPFVTKQIHDPKGIFLGVNRYHNSLVFMNPFTIDERNINNSNINIFGQSGMGKSVTAKLLAIRLYMKNSQVIIIDPEGEYIDFAKAMGGEVVDFSRNKGINPFSINAKDKNDVLDHIGVLKTFFKFFIRPQRFDGAILDKILMDLYDKYPKVKPTFNKFLKALEGTTMYDDIAILDSGSLKGVFNTDREINLDNDLIVFNLSSLGETEEKAPAMYLLSSLIWYLANEVSSRKKMLFIDEAHNLLVDQEVAVFYRKLVKQARKRNMGVVSITQDIQDFLDNDLGIAIITNSETKILLKQSYATIPLMEKIFPMTDDEKRQLGEMEIGEIVLYRQNEHMRVDILPLPFEEKIIGLRKIKKEKTVDEYDSQLHSQN
jgi:conjugal transfer ATP-binding protein TraC